MRLHSFSLFQLSVLPKNYPGTQKDAWMNSSRRQTVDKALLLQGFAIVGTAFLI